jgi:hypothetical protein
MLGASNCRWSDDYGRTKTDEVRTFSSVADRTGDADANFSMRAAQS